MTGPVRPHERPALELWLNIVFLLLAAALIVRFVRTGRIAMLRMMGGAPDSHDH